MRGVRGDLTVARSSCSQHVSDLLFVFTIEVEVREDGEGWESAYHMIAHGDEKIEEQRAAPLHLPLHGPAPLENPAASYDQCQVMRP